MANQMDTHEIVGSIDVISYSERVDSLIKSETASFFGDSPPYTYASLVDSAIRSSSASYEADYEPHNSTSTSLPSHSQPSYEADDKTFTRHSNKAFSGINREPMLWKTTLHSRFVHTVELLGDHQSKGISKTTPSSLSFPSYSEEINASSLPTPWSEGEILSFPNLKAFTWNELKNAAGNFRPDSFLGEGEFGFVYRGWIDEHTFTASKPGSGMVVAVKRLWPGNFQGYKEWLAGVNYLGQLHHPYLFKLIGYCLDVENRLLVYEFMPKGSLENYLFRRVSQQLSWSMRMKVAIGFARGLSFLHNAKSQVIHRRGGPTGHRTCVSTRGYASPEYVATGRLTTKSDVYNFGVMLLELLSGMEQNLVDWETPYMSDARRRFWIMDSKLEGQYPKKGPL